MDTRYREDDRKCYSRLNDGERILYDLFANNAGRKFSRQELRVATGLADHAMRICLHTIKTILPICNFQDGKGYWLSNNLEELSVMIKQEHGRRNELDKSINALETAFRDAGGVLC